METENSRQIKRSLVLIPVLSMAAAILFVACVSLLVNYVNLKEETEVHKSKIDSMQVAHKEAMDSIRTHHHYFKENIKKGYIKPEMLK